MGLLNDISIIKDIEVDKNHIDNFALESGKGTKKLREKFHRNAVAERNAYVEKQIKLFNYYSRKVYFELNSRVNRLLPNSNDEMFNEMKSNIAKYGELVVETNSNLSVSVKLRFQLLLSSITDTMSLNQLNECLRVFIQRFKDAGIILTNKDFIYSMFTKGYMDMYLANYDKSNFVETADACFEKVYFECPKIIMHLKMCLHNLLHKYENDLSKYLNEVVDKDLIKYDIDKKQVIPLYLRSRTEFMWAVEKDPYINLNAFLDKKENVTDYLTDSFVKEKKYSIFAVGGSYKALSDEAKTKYNIVIRELYGVLNELKDFERYEVILKDLIKRFKDRDKSKAIFDQKLKEVTESDKIRQKLLKDYFNSGKPKLFGFLSKDLTKVSKLHINEELLKLGQLCCELADAEFNYKMASILNDASSVYDIFESSLLSFYYIENMFVKNFGEEDDFDLEAEFRRYIKFLYSSFNTFLLKVNGLADYNITEIIADKYKILGLNLSVDDISKEKIDMTRDNLEFIVKSLCIEESNLNSEKMNYICKIRNINPLDGWEIVNEEII